MRFSPKEVNDQSKKKTMKEDSEQLGSMVALVANQNYAGATEILHDLLNQRVIDTLDDYKKTVSKNLFAPSHLDEQGDAELEEGALYVQHDGRHVWGIGEEIQQLDELKKSTLKSYLGRAVDNLSDASYIEGKHSVGSTEYKKAVQQVKKRTTGMKRAIGSIHEEYHVYDNGGETHDRYTAFTHKDHTEGKKTGGTVTSLGLSDNPTHPQGHSQFSAAQVGSHLGKKVSFKSLPTHIQSHIKNRLS